jgi:hypothetical protein
MKKVLFTLLLLVTTICSAQEEKIYTLSDALATQVYGESTTLSYRGRVFETDGTYVKGKRYFAVLKLTGCVECPVVETKTLFSHLSVQQTQLNIKEALEALKENEPKE